MRLKPQLAWSDCWITLGILDHLEQDGLYLSCKGSMFNVQNLFGIPGFLRKIWVSRIHQRRRAHHGHTRPYVTSLSIVTALRQEPSLGMKRHTGLRVLCTVY